MRYRLHRRQAKIAMAQPGQAASLVFIRRVEDRSDVLQREIQRLHGVNAHGVEAERTLIEAADMKVAAPADAVRVRLQDFEEDLPGRIAGQFEFARGDDGG